MPPQIKSDLNRSGWESTDMPSVCEKCLPDNPYVQMLKEDYGAECKICTRPFTLFKWKADRTSRQKRTMICLTCARLKNCCQHCMLDLQYGLPITIRDQALKMIAPGPQSTINREYYAQEHEKEIEEGRGAVEAYEKSDEKAMELLKKLAQSKQYGRRPVESDEGSSSMKALPAPESLGGSAPGPLRTRDTRPRGGGRGGRPGPMNGRPANRAKPPSEEDWLPPSDTAIKSLFILGVEDDLPEYKIREFFAKYGTLQSVICSHRAHCAYINYVKRTDAEVAADACHGRAIIAGCPLKVTWGKPKTLDTTDINQRMANRAEGRATASGAAAQKAAAITAGPSETQAAADNLDGFAAIAPPGSEDVNYASLRGD
ncbi:hypothetical protein FH972_021744 [Carpinus fangiana]|uniref:RRM domain-containing protein n=1 Tax=Carpinus fangiana TaxID=176857 RepID=A0A5N6KQT0_9ROSI|nr:hypothetical protein FH972_021744 [Carpinus fangiana]